ncbi:MAG: TIR domain-containing protein [Blastocatellia bacterium]
MSKPIVFISYSHKDEKWKDRLTNHLRVLDAIIVWEDRGIRAGEAWETRIQSAIATADAAILLISDHFLNSEFIKTKELPWLLQRKNQGMKFFPVIITDCAWQTKDWLDSIQCRPTDGRPVELFPDNEQNREWKKIAIEVHDLLCVSRDSCPETRPDLLYKIDFTLVETITDPIVKRLKSRDDNAALFLLPAARNFVGDYWSRRLLERLEDVSSTIRRYHFAPEEAGELLDADTLLRWIGREVIRDDYVADAPDLPSVIRGLSEVLNAGVLFFQLRFSDTLHDNEDLLRWLVEDFWRPLVCELKLKRRAVRVVMAIIATNELAETACAHPVFCPADAFDPCSILRLPLEEWNARMIEDWIIDHSDLMQAPDFDARAVAEAVFVEGKNGKPHFVDKALRRVLLSKSGEVLRSLGKSGEVWGSPGL